MPSRFTTPLEPVAAPPALPPPSAVAPTRNSFRLGRAAAGPGPPAIRSDILYRWPDGGWQLGRVWCRRRQAPFTHRGVVGYRTATATVAGEVSSGAANRPDRLSARRPDRLSFYRFREPTGKRGRGVWKKPSPTQQRRPQRLEPRSACANAPSCIGGSGVRALHFQAESAAMCGACPKYYPLTKSLPAPRPRRSDTGMQTRHSAPLAGASEPPPPRAWHGGPLLARLRSPPRESGASRRRIRIVNAKVFRALHATARSPFAAKSIRAACLFAAMMN